MKIRFKRDKIDFLNLNTESKRFTTKRRLMCLFGHKGKKTR